MTCVKRMLKTFNGVREMHREQRLEVLKILNTTMVDGFPGEVVFHQGADPMIARGYVYIEAPIDVALMEIKEATGPKPFLDLLKERVLEANYSIIEVAMENIRTVSGTKTT